jgi:hypothetical protein
MALRTQCKGVAEEGNGGIDIVKIISDVAFKASPREVGESCCMVRMAGQTLVQNQLIMLYSSVQVRDRPTRNVFGELRVTCICVSNNLAVYEGLQMAFYQQS